MTGEACDDLWRVAEALAWHWHSGGANDETATRRAVQQTGLATDERLVDKLLYDLRTPLGLIVRVDGRYAFAHQTMREYMVARRLRAAWKQDARRTRAFLRLRLHLPEWREPLALLVGGLPDDEAQQLLTWIMRARSPCERWLKRDLLLAAELVAESGKSAPEGMYPALRRALDQPFVRELTAKALGVLGDQQAVPSLIVILLGDTDVRTLVAVTKALGRTVDVHSAIDARAAAAAAEALGLIGDAQAVPFLINALYDGEEQVRKAAARALGRIGDATSVPDLIEALRDKDWQVRVAAWEALRQIRHPQAVQQLIDALRNNHGRVRAAALEALGQFDDLRAIPPLTSVLCEENFLIYTIAQVLRQRRWSDPAEHYRMRRAAARSLTSLLPRLRSAPPSRDLQRALPSIHWFALLFKHPDLLRAALLVEETWEAQRDPWRDPLEPPPVWHGGRRMQRISAATLEELALIVVALRDVVLAALAQVLAGLAAHPALLLAALVALALVGGLIGWLAERVRGR